MPRPMIELDRRFRDQAKGVFERYKFDVGIINDGIHKSALPSKRGLKNFAGGPARKTSQFADGTLSEVSKDLRKKTGINFYTKPFRARRNRDLLRLFKNFFDLCMGRTTKKRLENALQAVVRNPILRGDYGVNIPRTAAIKGFNRFMIDTGQLFKAIVARVRGKGVV